MAKCTTEGLLGALKEMTLVELTEFKKTLEEEFDVITAAPVVITAAGAVGGGAAAEEKDEFDVILEDTGTKEIGVIKAVREVVSGPDLKEAREMVKPVLGAILEGASKDDAETVKAKPEEAGAKVSLK